MGSNIFLKDIVSEKIRKHRAFAEFVSSKMTVDGYIKLYNELSGSRLKPSFYKKIYTECEEFLFGKSSVRLEPGRHKKVAPVNYPKYSHEDFLNQKKKLVPYCDYEGHTIGELMDIAVKQTIDFLLYYSTKKSSQSFAEKLQKVYQEGKSLDDVATEMDCTKESVRKPLKDFYTGKKDFEGCKVDPTFLTYLKDNIEPFVFKPATAFYDDHGIFDECQIDFFNKAADVVTVNLDDWDDCTVFIKDANKGDYTQSMHLLYEVICEEIVPVSLEKIEKDWHIAGENKDYKNNKLVEGVIAPFITSHPWIKTNDFSEYYIGHTHLRTDYQRIGRMLFNKKGFVKTQDVRDEYKKIYGLDVNFSGIPVKLGQRDDFYITNGDLYYSETHQPIDDFNSIMKAYAEEHIFFKWSDFVDEMIKSNRTFNEGTRRSFMMEICRSCLDDKDLLVLKGHEKNYPQYRWRKDHNMEISNWTLTTAIRILGSHQDTMDKNSFISALKSEADENGYSNRIMDIIFKTYSSPTNPLFVIDDTNIFLDRQVLENKYGNNLDKIGKKQMYLDAYPSIYAQTITALRKSEDHAMLLSDICKMVAPTLPEGMHVTTIRLALDDDNMPKEIYREKIDNRIYIKLRQEEDEEEIRKEIQYTIQNQPDLADAELPQVSVSTVEREVVSYRTILDWQKLKVALKRELAFYNRTYNTITSDAVLEKFESFMKKSDNSLLSSIIPQKMYEYFYGMIDRNLLFDYLLHITLDFETLLREIAFSCRPKEKYNGMLDICKLYYPDYAIAIANNAKQGFEGIVKDLNYHRNRFAHGDDIDLPITSLHIKFISYVALYVYTVDKYYQNYDHE